MKINKKSLGFTLIELLVVITITAILAVSVSVNLINVQKDAKLDSVANELAANLETARNRSVNGEVPTVSTDFDSNNMPYWSVEILSSSQYRIVPKCKLKDGSVCPSGTETISIKTGSLNPSSGSVDFARMTGKTSSTSIDVVLPGYTTVVGGVTYQIVDRVSVDSFGKVTVKEELI